MKVDEKIERGQIERLKSLREKRDAEKAENSLPKIEEAAKTDENLLPHILECGRKLRHGRRDFK